jgi:hypothetical protein
VISTFNNPIIATIAIMMTKWAGDEKFAESSRDQVEIQPKAVLFV